MMTKDEFKALRKEELPIYLLIKDDNRIHIVRVTKIHDTLIKIWFDLQIMYKPGDAFPRGPIIFSRDDPLRSGHGTVMVNTLPKTTQVTAQEAKKMAIRDILFR